MLIGEYIHTIDSKNRVSVPSKFRKELVKVVVITRGLDQCLFLYSLQEWRVLSKKLSQLSVGSSDARSFVRTMIGGAMDIEIDALGRILLPDYLKVYAGLEREAVIVGLSNRVEIWRPLLWKDYSEGAFRNTNVIAEKLGELGMY